jgi:uncharacterized damage-inducible protein DinB
MYRLLNPAKALRTLRKNQLILQTILANTSQHEAQMRRDGADGWTILEIVCHMRDIEAIYIKRIEDLLAKPKPIFAVVSNEVLMQRGNYQAQDLHTELAAYLANREQLITLIEPLTDDQWLLAGEHPSQGPATLLDVAINAGLHDIDHIEQIIRCA